MAVWCRPGQVGHSMPLRGACLETVPATEVSALCSRRAEGLRKQVPTVGKAHSYASMQGCAGG